MSKEKTAEQVREEFLSHVGDLVNYWEREGENKKVALEGLAFSIMSTLDGMLVLTWIHSCSTSSSR